MGNRVIDHRVAAVLQAGIVVAFLILWELGGRSGFLDPFFYSMPSRIIATIAYWARQGVLAVDLLTTVYEMLLGFALGTGGGIVLGYFLATVPILDAVFTPFMVLFNATPRLVLVPLFILWFGIGLASKVVLSAVIVIFPVLFATYSGIKEVDPDLIAKARVLGARPVDITWHVLIPSALSWVFSGLRVSVGFALIGAVVGEYLGANRGLGYRIAFSQAMFDATGVFAGLIVLLAVVWVIDSLVKNLEQRLSVWKPASSRVQGS
ncbi:MAG: ABC transporter permease [Armatimonadota bacterium]|nr:ABC transporter permease [Armatimonadota bacterium]